MKLKDACSLEESYHKPRQYIKKQRHTLLTKAHKVKVRAFPVVIYGCESWTITNAEHQRIDAFEWWCWRRPLRVPWTARRYNQSVLKKISPEYSLEGLMLKLKIQYFGHLIFRTDSLEKTLMMGKIEGRRRRGWQRMEWLNGITNSIDMCLTKLQDMVKDREPWHAAVHGAIESWTWLNEWTITTACLRIHQNLSGLQFLYKLFPPTINLNFLLCLTVS